MSMKVITALAAAAIAATPITASAGEQYATTEATYYSEDFRVVVLTTLKATGNQELVDGEYRFEGFAILAAEGLVIPVTVAVPEELPDQNVAVALETLPVGVKELLDLQFEAGGALVTKTVYEIIGAEEQGLLTVTDDPLPILPYLIIAGVSAIAVPIAAYMIADCERISTKVTFSTDGTASYETACDRTP